MSEHVIRVDGLSKKYKSIQALNQVSFSVPKGSVYGILGPNGSGKTTTLGILLGVIKQDQGAYSWGDYDSPHQARQNIGAILETPNFYPYLNAVDNLKITASIKGCGNTRIPEVLKQVNLWQRKKSAFKTYSLGMKQRLAIAAALLANPKVLVLDEPTNGLDPRGIAEVRELILRIAQDGITVIIASHMLDEIEKVCTDVLVLQKGEKLFEGQVSEVLNQGSQFKLGYHDLDLLEKSLSEINGVLNLTRAGTRIQIHLEGMGPEDLNKQLAEKGIWLSYLVQENQSLESYFLQLTKSGQS